MSNLDHAKAFYSASANSVLDFVRPDSGKGVYCNQTLEELRAGYPDVEILGFDEAYRRYNEGHCSSPEAITEEDFKDAWDVLPPQRVAGGGGLKSFMLSELYAGEIGSFYVRIDDRYFRLRQPRTTSHAELVALCRAAMVA